MTPSDIAQRLVLIEESLARIELALSLRVPIEDVRQAIEDVFATHGLVTQLREVYTTQRDELAALSVLTAELAHDASDSEERQEISRLLIQLLELGRKHVSGLHDLERAVGWRAGGG